MRNALSLFFSPRGRGLKLTAAEQCDENAGTVYCHLGVGGEFAVLLHYLRQSNESSGQSTDPFVDLGIERENIRDGGFQVGQLIDAQPPVHTC